MRYAIQVGAHNRAAIILHVPHILYFALRLLLYNVLALSLGSLGLFFMNTNTHASSLLYGNHAFVYNITQMLLSFSLPSPVHHQRQCGILIPAIAL
jgi:hypothetical protein